MSRIPDDVSVAKSKVHVVRTRGLVVPPGEFVTLATFNAIDGVKAVTAGVQSDVSHSMQLYVHHLTDDLAGAVFFGDDGVGAAAVQRKTMDRTNMKGTQITVVFNNADIVQHVIDADCLGWVN